jgi:hypothetical protein
MRRDAHEIILWIGQSELEFHRDLKSSNVYEIEKREEKEKLAF